METERFCGNCKFWGFSETYKIKWCHVEPQFTKVRATKSDFYCPYHKFLHEI